MGLANGFHKSLQLQLFGESRLHANDKDYDFNDPLWFVTKRDGVVETNHYTNLVMDLIMKPVTREVFGLTYNDLLGLELYEFNRIKEQVLKISEQRSIDFKKASDAIAR